MFTCDTITAVREKALEIESLFVQLQQQQQSSSSCNTTNEKNHGTTTTARARQNIENLIKEQIEEYELLVAQGSHDMTPYDVQQALAKQRTFRNMLQAMWSSSSTTTTTFRFVKQQQQQQDIWKKKKKKNINNSNNNHHHHHHHRTTTETTETTESLPPPSGLTLEHMKDRDDVTHQMMPQSSLMVNNLVNCTVTLTGYCGQQLRIHSTRDTLFRIQYDDTACRTDQIIIIEDCTNLRFQFIGGPRVDIQDFGWLKQGTPSPNVSIVE